MKPLNVISLFDGISCGRVALERAGIEVGNYYASEIDKYALQVAKKNYPNNINIGDVRAISGYQLHNNFYGKPDLLIGGSPCQGFSFAGKREGMTTECNIEITSLEQYLKLKEEGFKFKGQSYLFWEFVRIRKEINECRKMEELPEITFLLENVKMSKNNKNIISKTLEIEPIEINSALVSAQTRKRLYWTNILGVEQPKDREILIEDIIESNPENPVILSKATMKRFIGYGIPLITDTKIKARCLSAMDYVKNGKQGNYLVVQENTKKGYVLVSPDEGVDLTFIKSKTRRGRHMKSKSNCLTAANHEYHWWNGKDLRKFTPIECERLQTLKDNYTKGASNSQRYKMIGNGWTIDTIVHIFKNLRIENA